MYTLNLNNEVYTELADGNKPLSGIFNHILLATLLANLLAQFVGFFSKRNF
jgi:hypothetical protein